jgi:hypothetical protein
MVLQAPISHHVDLYRYWLDKRGSRAMPPRSRLDPGDIRALLPYMVLTERVDDQFRYRLVGTAVVQEFGYDPTGGFVGSYLEPGSAAAARAIHERAFMTAHPIFATGEFKAGSGTIHQVSQLALPLSDNGADVNMGVSTLVARFNFGLSRSADWLKMARLKVRDVFVVCSAPELEKRCGEWERHCDDQRPLPNVRKNPGDNSLARSGTC